MATDIIRLTTVEKFIDTMPVSKSVDHELMKKLIFIEQDTAIQNLLGTSLYQGLLDEIDDTGTLTPTRLELIQKYVRPALHHLAFASAILHLKFRVTDKGILEQSDDNAAQADNSGLHKLSGKHVNKSQFYQRLAIDFICDNDGAFPEYDDETDEFGIRPDKEGYNSGIVY